MKTIQKDELYEHLSGFLKGKGIELTEGSYSQTIQKSCSILADAINLGQKGIQKAKTGIDEKLDQMRQAIHEKTAPPSAKRATAASATPQAGPAASDSGSQKRKPKKAKNRRSKS